MPFSLSHSVLLPNLFAKRFCCLAKWCMFLSEMMTFCPSVWGIWHTCWQPSFSHNCYYLSAGKCVPYQEGMCSQFGYDGQVAIPGFAGFRHPAQGTAKLEIIAAIIHSTHCYKHSLLFGCAALIPSCSSSQTTPIPPCRSLCESKCQSKFLNL